MSLPPFPRLTDHGSEIILLGVVAVGVLIVLGLIVAKGGDGWDVAAFLLVLQRVVEAVTARWQARSNDRTVQALAPPATPTKSEDTK